jgi:rhamnose utilization protein RhaD (predicted bifunctional aldolase and dehydrogenase)
VNTPGVFFSKTAARRAPNSSVEVECVHAPLDKKHVVHPVTSTPRVVVERDG